MLSRNKTINYLHAVTGWSYKECRTKLKANSWSLYCVLYPDMSPICKAFESLDMSPIIKAFESLNEAVVNFAIRFKDNLNSIDFDKIINGG